MSVKSSSYFCDIILGDVCSVVTSTPEIVTMNGGSSRSKFGSLLGVLYVGHTSCKFLVSMLLRFKDDYRFDCETTIKFSFLLSRFMRQRMQRF